MEPDLEQLQRAWDLIAYFFGERSEPVADIRPELLTALAHRHRLDAALAEPRLTAVSPEAYVTSATWRQWRAAHAAALARTLWRTEPARRVFEALAPTPVIVLKGAAYAELLYPSPGARSMGDLDVLVPAASLAASLVKLEAIGFTRHHPGDPTLDAPDFHERQLGSADLELDLHQGFTQAARLRIDYGAVFDRSLPWPAVAPNARLLDPNDALLHQIVHAGCAELTPDWCPAIGLLDLRQMLRRDGPFWGVGDEARLDLEVVVERARGWGAERMLYAVLAAAARLFPSVGQAAERAAEALPRGLRSLLQVAVVDRSAPPRLASPPRSEVLLRKALLLRPVARYRLLRARLPQLWAARSRQLASGS